MMEDKKGKKWLLTLMHDLCRLAPSKELNLSRDERCILKDLSEYHRIGVNLITPSIKAIARSTGYARSSVFATIKKLELKGILVREKRFDEYGDALTNQYYINVQALTKNLSTGVVQKLDQVVQKLYEVVQNPDVGSPATGQAVRKLDPNIKYNIQAKEIEREREPEQQACAQSAPLSLSDNFLTPQAKAEARHEAEKKSLLERYEQFHNQQVTPHISSKEIYRNQGDHFSQNRSNDILDTTEQSELTTTVAQPAPRKVKPTPVDPWFEPSDFAKNTLQDKNLDLNFVKQKFISYSTANGKVYRNTSAGFDLFASNERATPGAQTASSTVVHIGKQVLEDRRCAGCQRPGNYCDCRGANAEPSKRSSPETVNTYMDQIFANMGIARRPMNGGV